MYEIGKQIKMTHKNNSRTKYKKFFWDRIVKCAHGFSKMRAQIWQKEFSDMPAFMLTSCLEYLCDEVKIIG